jgi:segregation and condensation protein A
LAIPIAKITDQYLQYLELMQALDLEVAGEFLVVAATLMQIKSRMLLPPEALPPAEEEPDPAQELIERLKEYQRFKEAAEVLSGMEKQRLVQFSRPVSREGEPAGVEEYVEASLFDLLNAFSQFMSGEVSRNLFLEVIQEEFTVEQKVGQLREMIRQAKKMSFTELLRRAKAKPEMIVIFLGLLELIRLKEILIVQDQLFSEILILEKPNDGS